MKRILIFLIILLFGVKSYAQSDAQWYGYPKQRQVSSFVGGIVGGVSYAVVRTSIPNEPKWKPILISTAFTTGASILMYSVYNISPVDRRQNFTASMLSGISITVIFSLGI